MFKNRAAVAEPRGEVLGFIAFAGGEILRLQAQPSFMRSGARSALVLHTQKLSSGKMSLEGLFGNNSALAFYKCIGFSAVEIRHGKMPGNETFEVSAHVMEYMRAK